MDRQIVFDQTLSFAQITVVSGGELIVVNSNLQAELLSVQGGSFSARDSDIQVEVAEFGGGTSVFDRIQVIGPQVASKQPTDALSESTTRNTLTEAWVDFGFTGEELGTRTNPFNTLTEALAAVQPGGTILFRLGLQLATSELLTIARDVLVVGETRSALIAIDADLAFESGFNDLAVQLIDDNSQPLGQSSVVAKRLATGATIPLANHGSGLYSVGRLEPGIYDLIAVTPTQPIVWTEFIMPDSGISSVTLATAESTGTGTVEVQTTSLDGSGVLSDAAVLEDLNSTLILRSSAVLDGAVRIDDVPTGSYLLRSGGGGFTVTEDEVTVSSAETTSTSLTATFDATGLPASVSGTVIDASAPSQGLSGMTVFATTGNNNMTVFTDSVEDGVYIIPDIPVPADGGLVVVYADSATQEVQSDVTTLFLSPGEFRSDVDIQVTIDVPEDDALRMRDEFVSLDTSTDGVLSLGEVSHIVDEFTFATLDAVESDDVLDMRELLLESIGTYESAGIVYLDSEAVFSLPDIGSSDRPFDLPEEAIGLVENNGEVRVRAGAYPRALFIARPMRIMRNSDSAGIVRLGSN